MATLPSIQDIINLSIRAGEKILEIYQDPDLFGDIDYKADDSPLTRADRASHNCIAEGLMALYPGIPILSEEGRDIPFEERSSWTTFWCVDPLDGTKEFIKRNGEFTVNIALIEAGRPILGVVHVPVTGETFYAVKGEGANSIQQGEAVRLKASDFSMEQSGIRVVASRSHMSESVTQYVSKLASPRIVSMGSSLKFMLVAGGKADVYPRLAPTMEWDTAAAQIIVEEAGGTVLQYPSNKPLVYNKENLLNPHFIAFAKK